MLQSLNQILQRELKILQNEIELFPEVSLWEVHGEIKNSAGNLAIHICGGLEHFIGFGLGNTGYIRDRDFEFQAKGLSKEEIYKIIADTSKNVDSTLKNMDPQTLTKPYPAEVADRGWNIEFFLIHLVGHMNYHLGQINYLRRLL